MDAGALSTISALAGTAIGALSPLGTTWLTAESKERAARVAAEREDLYGSFMDEFAKLYSGTLNAVGADYERLTGIYTLSGRLSLHASEPVVVASEQAMRFVVDLSLGAVPSPEEMRTMTDSPEANVIGAFAKACRGELQAVR